MLRLMLGPFSAVPRGIDRIEFGYATYLHRDWPAEFVGVAPMFGAMRWFARPKLAEGLAWLDAQWRETMTREEDAAYARVKRFLADPAHPLAKTRRRPKVVEWARGACRFLRFMTAGTPTLGGSMRTLPQNAIYLNVGHFGLSVPFFLSWLDRRPDVVPVFMIHDVIPLETPELVASSTRAGHDAMMKAVMRHARTIIAPSESSKQETMRELKRRGARDIPIKVATLPVSDAFLAPMTPDPALTARSYFVICGAIEPRKNHLLVLNIWKELVRQRGDSAPALIIAGSPGWSAQSVLDVLQNCDELRRHVHLASGLSTPALRSVMAGARALLMPSFAEGFGLPPVEALSTGTPVVLSGIAAHREASGDFAIYLDPNDAQAWKSQIEMMIADTPDYLALRAKVAGFRPKTWPAYIGEVEDILNSID